VNDVGIRIGIDENGNVFQSSSFCIQGPSMEANQTAIQVRAGAGGNISFNCGSGVPVAYGLHIMSVQDVLVSGVAVGSAQGFSQAGIAVDGGARIVMMGVSAPSWRIHPSIDTSAFLQTNKP
jgi:hypothetical protein